MSIQERDFLKAVNEFKDNPDLVYELVDEVLPTEYLITSLCCCHVEDIRIIENLLRRFEGMIELDSDMSPLAVETLLGFDCLLSTTKYYLDDEETGESYKLDIFSAESIILDYIFEMTRWTMEETIYILCLLSKKGFPKPSLRMVRRLIRNNLLLDGELDSGEIQIRFQDIIENLKGKLNK